VPTYRFLTPDWIDAVRRIRESVGGTHGAEAPLRANFTVTAVEFIEGGVFEYHSDNELHAFFAPGHSADADLSLEMDYATAERIYKDRSINLQELRDANQSGEVVVGGDIEALVEWWRSMVGDVERLEMWDQIQDVTS